MRSRLAPVSLCLACVILAGCPADPGLFVRQGYILRIADAASGSPVYDASVTSWVENRRPRGESADEFLDGVERNAEGDGDGVATTNDEGEAELTLTSGVLCGGGDCDLDEVTRRLFLVRVKTEVTSEVLTVRMEPGETVSGDAFTVTVISIDPPRASAI